MISTTRRTIDLFFYGSIATIFIYSAYVENTSTYTALKIKYGENGHKTFFGRIKYKFNFFRFTFLLMIIK